MKKVVAVLAVLATSAIVLFTVSIASAVPPVGQLCPAGDSGKIDTTGDPLTITVDAGAGNVITSICVKAGSVQNGGGAVILLAGVDFPAGQQTVTVSYPSGKAISHYSFTTEEKKDPPPPCDPKVEKCDA